MWTQLMRAITGMIVPYEHHRLTRETIHTEFPTEADHARVAAAQTKRERKNEKRLRK